MIRNSGRRNWPTFQGAAFSYSNKIQDSISHKFLVKFLWLAKKGTRMTSNVRFTCTYSAIINSETEGVFLNNGLNFRKFQTKNKRVFEWPWRFYQLFLSKIIILKYGTVLPDQVPQIRGETARVEGSFSQNFRIENYTSKTFKKVRGNNNVAKIGEMVYVQGKI